MKRSNVFPLLILLFSIVLFSFCQHPDQPKVLVFSKTAGYRHASIPNGIEAIQQIGKEHGFMVEATEDATYFQDDRLKQYTAVIFLSTTGNVLDSEQESSFKKYINSGGGF